MYSMLSPEPAPTRQDVAAASSVGETASYASTDWREPNVGPFAGSAAAPCCTGHLERENVPMEPIGPKLAEGRDSEIYEHGPGRVLRLARDGRSLAAEADVMRFVRERGYPVPGVYDAGEGYLVMDRLTGPTMLESALRHPYRIGAYGHLLAHLHIQLHEIEAPGWLTTEAAAKGDCLLHRDLHPLNVLMTAEGPVVIDWANAARGDPAYDVADTWVLFATADAPGNSLQRSFAAVARRIFLRNFLADLDADAARAVIPPAVQHRLVDRNMTEVEKERMRRLSAWATSGRPAPRRW
jgi:Phosphotransferase enzyme family